MVFGFEGGLAGRPRRLLMNGNESASVALSAHKGSILRQTYRHRCFLVLCGPRGQRGGFWESQLPVKRFSPCEGLSLGLQCVRDKLSCTYMDWRLLWCLWVTHHPVFLMGNVLLVLDALTRATPALMRTEVPAPFLFILLF